MIQITLSKRLKFNCKLLISILMLTSVVYVANVGVQVDLSVRIQRDSSLRGSTPQTSVSDISSDSYSLEISAKGIASAQTLGVKSK